MCCKLTRFWTLIIGDSSRFSLEERIYNTVSFVMLLVSLFVLPYYLQKNAKPFHSLLDIIGFIIIIVIYYLGRFHKRKFVVINIFLFMFAASALFLTNNSYVSGVPAYFILMLAFSIVQLRGKTQLIMVLLVLGNYLALELIGYFYGYQYPRSICFPIATGIFHRGDILFGILIVMILLAVLLKTIITDIDRERAKSENLLLNIIPAKIVGELKEYTIAEPEVFENVSIMLLDIVGWSDPESKPEILAAELEKIFTTLDAVAMTNRCERIKTFGDTHIYICGMPVAFPEHAEYIIKSAIEFISFLKNYNTNAKLKWEIRIGIHTGKVTGLVIGKTKYIYDLFGDTISIASKMEANSAAMRINISEATYQIVKDVFAFQERRPLFIKGKGAIGMYFVLDEMRFFPVELADDCRMLSKREAEIALLICQRLSIPRIAEQFAISPRTVERHIANIYEKLKVNTRRELIKKLLKENRPR